MITRLATNQDALILQKMLLAMHDECGFLEVDANKVKDELFRSIDEYMCYVLVDNDIIIGTIALEACAPWWSREWRMQDRWIYVKPENRSLVAFKSLIKIAVGRAEHSDVPLYIMLNVEGCERKRKLFARYMEEAMAVYEIKYVGGSFRHKGKKGV